MDWKEKILPHRQRIAFIVPFILLITVALLHVAPFASLGYETVVSNELISESTTKFYPEHVVVEDYNDATAETFAPFGGTTTETFEYDLYGFLDDIDELAQDIDDRIGTLTVIVFVMAIIAISTRGLGLNLHPRLDWRTVSGISMAVLAVLFLLLASSIQGGFGDSIEELLEEVADNEEVTSFNDGTWGKAVIEESETTTFTFSWGPSWMYWLAVVGCLAGAIGAFAALSHHHPNFESEELPIWPDNQAPAWMTADHSARWFSVFILAVLVAIVAPWYSVDQTWVKSEEVGEVYTNSTHRLGWTLSPFYAHFANDTGLFIGEGGGEESELSSYNTMYELDSMAPILLSLRWPLLLTGVLVGGWACTRFVRQAQEHLDFRENQRNVLFAAAVVFVMMFSATADFEDSMTRIAADDLRTMSPMLNSTFVHAGAQDTFSGQSFDVDFEFDGNKLIMSYAAMEWGPSFGFHAFSWLPWLGVGLLCSIGLPRWLERQQKEEQDEAFVLVPDWRAKPVMAVLVSVLLVSLLASFPPSTLGNGSSSAPGSLSQWNLNYDYRDYYDSASGTLSDGETYSFGYDTTGFSLGNTTFFLLDIYCEEGQQGLLSDEPDEMAYTVQPPEGVQAPEQTLSGTLQCPSSNQIYVEADVSLPEDEYAASAEAFLGLISIQNSPGGQWSIEFTATTKGGDTAFDGDNGLDYEYYINIYGLDGFTASERDD